MRIAFVTEVWQPTINGVVTRLAATIEELRDGGHDVLVVAPGAPGTSVSNGPVSVRTVPTLSVPFVYGGQPWGLPVVSVGDYLDEFRPDVVHVVNPALLGIAGVISACRRGLPLVCSYHTDLVAYARYYHMGWLKPAIRAVLRALHRRAAINLVTSAAAGRQLAEIGVPRIARWGHGVDLERFRPAPVQDPARRDVITALYVGRLAAEKQLGALAELAGSPDVQLVVVGDGPARSTVERQLRRIAAEFTGALAGEELAAAYRRADVFVFPSATETLGLVLLEALASGLPIAAADSPAIREVLEGCQAARRWEVGESGALGRAIRDVLGSAPRAELACMARRHVEGRTWSGATAGLVEHYHRAIGQVRTSDGSPPRRRRAGRFVAVGAVNAAIDLGFFNALSAADPTSRPLQLALYNTIAVVLALINSYCWNSRWTFRPARDREQRWSTSRRRLLFAAQGVCNIAVNDVAVVVAVAVLGVTGVLAPVVVTNASKVAGMVTASATSFVAMRLVVFRHVHREPTGPHVRRTRRPGLIDGR